MKTKNLGSGCPHQVQTHWSVLPFQDSKSPSSFINNNKSKRPIPGISDSRPTLWAITVLLPCACCGSTHSDLCSPGASRALPTKMTKLSPNTANAPRGQSHSGENLSTQTGPCNFTYLTLVHIQEEGEKGRCFREQGSYQKSFPACASPPRM